MEVERRGKGGIFSVSNLKNSVEYYGSFKNQKRSLRVEAEMTKERDEGLKFLFFVLTSVLSKKYL
jgi:hypothetical protein